MVIVLGKSDSGECSYIATSDIGSVMTSVTVTVLGKSDSGNIPV